MARIDDERIISRDDEMAKAAWSKPFLCKKYISHRIQTSKSKDKGAFPFMERIYYRFPQEIDFERRYGYKADLRYLLKVMASINGKSGSIDFDTPGLDVKRHVDTVRARRDVTVEVSEKRMDFIKLTPPNLAAVLPTLEPYGTVDFRITVGYTYVDSHFDRLPLESDVYLVRVILDGELTLQVATVKGQGRTMPEEIANTIETQLKNFKG